MKLLLLGLLMVLSINASAQSQVDLIQKARAAGMSEAQIQTAIQQQGQQQKEQKRSKNKNTSTEFFDFESDRVDTVQKSQAERAYIPLDSLELNLDSIVFGREIFYRKNLTFSPIYNLPTPKDYVLGAGDEVHIRVWGNSELSITQKITPEGRIFIENLGPIHVGGLHIDKAEARVKSEMSVIYRGLNDGTNTLSLTLGQIRSIKVNIVGEAFVPGTYTLPSFSTVFNALYVAGGVSDIGSLRSIKVYRGDVLKAELDVYDYLFEGKSKDNIRLDDGDIVIISPYENLVRTKGELKRNRMYEMKKGETLAALLDMAGSFKGNAYSKSVQVERKNGAYYSIKTVKEADFGSFAMADGDTLFVRAIAERYDNRISVEGAVWYPGNYEFSPEVHTVKQLVEEASGLKGDEFAGRAQIVRTNLDFTKKVVAVDIRGIMNGTAEDVELHKDDVLNIPSLFDLREEYTIKVAGAVNESSDTIEYRANMTVEDAIIMAGGLKESAATVNVDISRRVKSPKSTEAPTRIVDVFTVVLQDGLALSADGESIRLEPFDEIYVRYSPGYREQEVISVDGEVIFKGDYVLKNVNSRLSDILKDAGGITSEAYARGASLTRLMSEDEQKKVEVMLKVIDSNSRKDSVSEENIEINSYSVGINLELALANPGSDDDIVLRDGDVLFIPKKQSTVKISGAVLYPNSTTYKEGMSVKKYIEQAGGYADYARKRPIVIYMNGQVATTKGLKYPKIEPGCEVLVPTKRQRQKASLAEILSIASSTTSMAAMVTSMINSFAP